MGLARHIRGMEVQRQPIIIFVTGYEKYAYDAFDVGAFQYWPVHIDVPAFLLPKRRLPRKDRLNGI